MALALPNRRALTLALVVSPLAALAANQHANFETHIHEHEFSRVDVQEQECRLSVRVYFQAPAAQYASESPERNVYRFHVRTKLAGDHQSITRVFNNRAPGARVYAYVQDTAAEGCWAKDEPKIQAIDVEGCRGAGCRPEPFGP